MVREVLMRLCNRYGVSVLPLDNMQPRLGAGPVKMVIESDVTREAAVVQTNDLDSISRRASVYVAWCREAEQRLSALLLTSRTILYLNLAQKIITTS